MYSPLTPYDEYEQVISAMFACEQELLSSTQYSL